MKKVSDKTKQKGKYLVFGLLNTGINYGMYEALALLVFKEEGQLWIATLISGAISIFVGYFLHSHFTWKDREVGGLQLLKFFIWNVILNLAVRPLLTAFFGLFGFLYEFAFSICQGIGIGFTQEFVTSTGNYVLMTTVTMVINFLVYDKFVFGESKRLAKKEVSEKKVASEKKSEG